MAKSKSAEELEKAWWEAWWDEDYSWGGLSKKEWSGWVVDDSTATIHAAGKRQPKDARPATLQDYWRDQERDLITAPDGRQFTPIHLPLHWMDGTETAKLQWRRTHLDDVVIAKLAAATSTKVTVDGEVKGQADGRAQFCGSVLLRPTVDPKNRDAEIHINAERAYFKREVFYTSRKIGDGANFSSAFFAGGARFSETTFSGMCLFMEAQFLGEAIFYRTIFEDFVTFDGATFVESASFRQAKFADTAWFWDAIFRNNAIFDGVEFKGRVMFCDVHFEGNGTFLNAAFASSTDFCGSHLSWSSCL